MGRTAQPTALKLVKGTRKDRINTDEPVPVGEIERPEISDGAAEVWARLAPDLMAKRVLTAWDIDAFATYCEAVAHNREAARHLADEKAVVRGSNGPAKNPWFQVFRDTTAVMVQTGSRFGLTPSDRANLKVGDGAKRDDKESFLS